MVQKNVHFQKTRVALPIFLDKGGLSNPHSASAILSVPYMQSFFVFGCDGMTGSIVLTLLRAAVECVYTSCD